MKKFSKFIFCILLIFCYSNKITAKNTWVLDKELSKIKFELPVLFTKKVEGQFVEFDGFVVIDQENNRALFSVQINSMEINYDKYKDILLSNIFFDETNFPIAVINTNKFTIPDNPNKHILLS